MASHAGRTRRLVILSLLGSVVIVLGFFSAAGFAISYTETIEERFPLHPGERLSVQGLNGGITYERWPGDEVVIRATKTVRWALPGLARWHARQVHVRVTRDDRGVSVTTVAPRWVWGWNTEIALAIWVPEGWSGTIHLQTSNGPIHAEDVQGQAILRTSNGPVRVTRHVGELDIRTSNGSVRLSQVDGVLQVRTSNGPISIDGARLRAAGRLQTSNGAVYLRARLDAQAQYQVETSNGRIDLALIEPDVALDLRTSNGSIRPDTPVLTSDMSRNRLVGQIGDGSARLVARTSNGSITLSAAR